MMYGGRGNSVVLSGAKMYNGWEYFGWSAGYDTAARDEVEIDIYEAEDPLVLYSLTEKAGIDYIVVDSINRESDMYELNEENIAESFERVFTIGEGDDRFSIYDVSKKLKVKG